MFEFALKEANANLCLREEPACFATTLSAVNDKITFSKKNCHGTLFVL